MASSIGGVDRILRTTGEPMTPLDMVVGIVAMFVCMIAFGFLSDYIRKRIKKRKENKKYNRNKH